MFAKVNGVFNGCCYQQNKRISVQRHIIMTNGEVVFWALKKINKKFSCISWNFSVISWFWTNYVIVLTYNRTTQAFDTIILYIHFLFIDIVQMLLHYNIPYFNILQTHTWFSNNWIKRYGFWSILEPIIFH